MENPTLCVGNKIAKRDAEDFLDEVKDLLPWSAGEKILDVGCGPGDVTKICLTPRLRDGYTLVGCDISYAMVEFAKTQYENIQVSFKKMDISDECILKNWEKETYDKIFSFYCLHWVTNQIQSIKNMYTLLKNPGYLVLMLPNLHPCLMMFRSLQQNKKWHPYTKNMESWDVLYNPLIDTREEYIRMLNETGFAIIKCVEVEKSWIHTSKNTFLDYLEAINPFVANVPKESKEEFLAYCEKLLFERGLVERNNKKEIIQKYTLLYVVVKKSL